MPPRATASLTTMDVVVATWARTATRPPAVKAERALTKGQHCAFATYRRTCAAQACGFPTPRPWPDAHRHAIDRTAAAPDPPRPTLCRLANGLHRGPAPGAAGTNGKRAPRGASGPAAWGDGGTPKRR